MPIHPEELKRRLERADALRLKLRRATLELREMGRKARRESERRDGSGRPDRGRPRGR